MYCKTCGKEVNDQAVVCPHCGCAVQNTQLSTTTSYYEKPKANILCIVGFVLSLVSLLIALYGLVAIAGLTCSIVGILQANKNSERLKGLGIAGICVSVGSLIYTVYAIFTLIALLGTL